MAVAWILAAAALLVCLLLHWYWRYSRWRRMELALPGPKSLPVLGNALDVAGVPAEDMLDVVLRLWGGRTGELSRISLFNQLLVFVSDPDHIKEVIRCHRFDEKPWFGYNVMKLGYGEGLVTMRGAEWKSHRMMMEPAVHLEMLRRFVHIFSGQADLLVARLRDHEGEDVDILPELYITSAMTTIRTFFKVAEEDIPEIEQIVPNIEKLMTILGSRVIKPWLWSDFLFGFTTNGRFVSNTLRRFEDLAIRIIDRKFKEFESRVDDQEPFCPTGIRERNKTIVDVLLDATSPGQAPVSREQIVDQFKTIVGAATMTSADALCYVFKMLAIYPEVQSRVYEEVCSVFEGSDRPVVDADFPRLEYTGRVIKETQRFFPAAPILPRDVTEDTELFGYKIPAGTALLINAFSAHRDPRHWPDPLTFDPDRFLPERSEGRHPYAFFPYSAGPRKCIAWQYAIMQMKTVVATTVRAFRLLPTDDGIEKVTDIKLTIDILLRSIQKIKVRFEPRVKPIANPLGSAL